MSIAKPESEFLTARHITLVQDESVNEGLPFIVSAETAEAIYQDRILREFVARDAHLDAVLRKHRTYKRQIRELQRALMLQKQVSEMFLSRMREQREAYQERIDTLESAAPKTPPKKSFVDRMWEAVGL